jgi:hypothetical protein
MYRTLGVAGVLAHPTPLTHMLALLDTLEGNRASRQALANRLQPLLTRLEGVPRPRQIIDVSSLWGEAVVMDVSGCSHSGLKEVFITFLVYYFYFYRLAEGGLSNRLEELVVLDEAWPYLGDEQAPLVWTTRMTRAVGLSILAGSQRPLAPTVVSNQNLIIVGVLMSHRDQSTLWSGSLGLTMDQQRYLKRVLRTGVFAQYNSQPPWNQAQLLTVPSAAAQVPMPSEAMVTEATERFLRLPAVQTDAYDAGVAAHPGQINPSVGTNERSTTSQSSPHTSASHADGDLDVLVAVMQTHSFQTAGQVYERSGLSKRRAIDAKKRGVRTGIIRELSLRTGGRGRPRVYLEHRPSWSGPPGFCHELMAEALAAELRSEGFMTGREVVLAGGRCRVDVTGTKGVTTILVEVQTIPDRAVHHLRALSPLLGSQDELWFVVPDDGLRQQLTAAFGGEEPGLWADPRCKIRTVGKALLALGTEHQA